MFFPRTTNQTRIHFSRCGSSFRIFTQTPLGITIVGQKPYSKHREVSMKKNKLWMNAGAALFAAMLLTAGALLAQGKAPAKGQSKTFEGVVTDAMCGAGHS